MKRQLNRSRNTEVRGSTRLYAMNGQLITTFLVFCVHVCGGWHLPDSGQRVVAPAVVRGSTLSRVGGGGGIYSPSVVSKHSSFLLASERSDGFVATDSGLKYKDITRGEGKTPEAGQTVRVNYVGWLEDFENEKKFDSSYDRRTPLSFKVGTHQVISGWDEALLTDMPVGTKRQVIIPSELGYGKRGAGGVIPPNADLYFVMELVGIGVR